MVKHKFARMTENGLQRMVNKLLPEGERPVRLQGVKSIKMRRYCEALARIRSRIIYITQNTLKKHPVFVEWVVLHELAHMLCPPNIGHSKLHKQKEEVLALSWGLRLERRRNTVYIERIFDAATGKLLWQEGE